MNQTKKPVIKYLGRDILSKENRKCKDTETETHLSVWAAQEYPWPQTVMRKLKMWLDMEPKGGFYSTVRDLWKKQG